MFGPLKYLFYLIILGFVVYGILLALPSFFAPEQIETTVKINIPTPQLLDQNK